MNHSVQSSSLPTPSSTANSPRAFRALLFGQFFGAANDNLLKGILSFMVINGVWAGQLGPGGQGIVGLLFTLPFVLLSGYGGQLCDRHSKRSISILLKGLEIPFSAIAWLGFYFENLGLTLFALMLLSCQSAYFGPAKYGMIPEIVVPGRLSRANGWINMSTNIAVILATQVAGWTSDHYSPINQNPRLGNPIDTQDPWLPGTLMIALALVGWISIRTLPPLPPGCRELRYQYNPLKIYVDALKSMNANSVLPVVLAWGYFYFLAGIALMIIPEYSEVLSIPRGQASWILGVMAISIGLGSVITGRLARNSIGLRLIPMGAVGMSVCFALLGLISPTLTNALVLVGCTGFFAGFYIIPLQSLMQLLSPSGERGRFLGTANALSFAFLSLSGVLYWLIRPAFGEQPQKIFLLCAALMSIVLVVWHHKGRKNMDPQIR